MSMIVRVTTWALIGLLLAAASGCQTSDPTQTETTTTGGTTMSIVITSTAFNEGESIPVEYTCNGKNISPPLAWKDLPTDTQSLALIADDPDAPAGTWVHWVLYNLPASTDGLPAGVENPGIEGQNSSRKIGYAGPCPPAGKPHRYFFKLYALDTHLDLNPGATKAELEKAMQGHILGQGQLMGTFKR
jgi:Raf kinase inhibitor-like YbhB/YbcL family protein